MNNFKLNFLQWFYLTKRHFVLFFRDKVSFFFSLISPIVVLGIFLLFLKRIQVDSLEQAFLGIAQGIKAKSGFSVTIPKTIADALVTSWMLCGLLSVSTITITLGTVSRSVDDKVNNVDYVFKASPINKSTLIASYISATFLTSFVINLLLYLVSISYLAAVGYIKEFNVLLFFAGIFYLALSVLSASTIFILIVSFFTKVNQITIFTTLIGTLSGFVVGAYIPLSYLPKIIQYAVLLIPGFYTTSLLKTVFMNLSWTYINSLSKASDHSDLFIKEIYNGTTIGTDFKPETHLFGNEKLLLEWWVMVLVLVISSLIFFLFYLIVANKKFGFKKKNIVK